MRRREGSGGGLSRVIVATVGPWNLEQYDSWRTRSGHTTLLIRRPDELTPAAVQAFGPDCIFFLQWYWHIPATIYDAFECVLFHMTDLPFGRGGSPLQNLILRGVGVTQMTALRVTGEVDAGPVYLKRPLSLDGRAEEIYRRASALMFEMADEFLTLRPPPQPQQGQVVTFKRRTPADSEIPAVGTVADLYNFVRMLDADGYPPAFLTHAGYRYEFSRAVLSDGRLSANVRITPIKKETS